MNYAIKLLIPLALGVVAAIINFAVLSSLTKGVKFVTVKEELKIGETFDLDNAEELVLPAQFANLSRSLVRYSERGALSGRIVRRTISKGDPIFYADTDLGGQWLALEPSEELFPVSLDEVSVSDQLLRIGNLIRFRVPPIGDEAGPLWLGPFRIVAVGSKINNNFSEGRRIGAGGNLAIGIAYNSERDAKSLERLEQFCDMQQNGEASMLGVRIVDTRK